MTAKSPAVPTQPTMTGVAQTEERTIKEQVVLVLQGGGALGAYQAGVYQALMEGGIKPDWVIGTSIGAINGAIIAGNEPENRIARLHEFWTGVGKKTPIDQLWPQLWPSSMFGNSLANLSTIMGGIPGFFSPNPHAMWGPTFPLGIERASYYTTEPLKATLGRLVDFDYINRRHVRFSVGAVNVRSSEMRYFDSHAMPLGPVHVMASGALPPAFQRLSMPEREKSMSLVWSSPSRRGNRSRTRCMSVPQPYCARSCTTGSSCSSAGRRLVSSRTTWRRRWICAWRATWLLPRLANWMSLWRAITCWIVVGSEPVGCHTLTEKISELRRGTSSRTTSIGVFE